MRLNLHLVHPRRDLKPECPLHAVMSLHAVACFIGPGEQIIG
jgi:hypothetical protein